MPPKKSMKVSFVTPGMIFFGEKRVWWYNQDIYIFFDEILHYTEVLKKEEKNFINQFLLHTKFWLKMHTTLWKVEISLKIIG